MDFKVKRKFTNRMGQSRMVSIPPFFLDAMNAMDSNEVILSVQDENHIVLEIVREGNQCK